MSLYDQEIANRATAVDQCMTLGAVILKPKHEPTVGFVASADIKKIVEDVTRQQARAARRLPRG